MKKILIFTASFGEGHNTAAFSLKAALEQVAPGEVDARVLDIFHIAYGRRNELAKKAYLATINHTPRVWSKVYDLLDRTKMLEWSLPTMAAARKTLRDLLEREKPDAVVSTYPVYNFLLGQIFDGTPPFTQITIVTDSITVNSVWHRAPSGTFIVPNEETAEVMRAAKVPAEKIRVLGFPVTPRFAANDHLRLVPSDAAGRRVLYMINFAKDSAPALVCALLNIREIELTVTVGKDEELRARVEEVVRKSGRTVEIHGWTQKMPELVMRSHLLISKAGGATVQEAIAARTPMIISQVVPGQEEGNARLIVNRKCGVVAETHDAIVGAVESAFADGGKVWREWHENISQLSRPAAALDIARFVLSIKSPTA